MKKKQKVNCLSLWHSTNGYNECDSKCIWIVGQYTYKHNNAKYMQNVTAVGSLYYLIQAWSRVWAGAGCCAQWLPPSGWQWKPQRSSVWHTEAQTTWTANNSRRSGSYGSPRTGQRRHSGDPSAARTLCNHSSVSSEEACVSHMCNSTCLEKIRKCYCGTNTLAIDRILGLSFVCLTPLCFNSWQRRPVSVFQREGGLHWGFWFIQINYTLQSF